MKSKWRIFGLAAMVLLVVGSLGFYTLLKMHVVSDDRAIRERSYQQIKDTLAVGAKPEDWNAAVFISSAAVDRAVALMKGTTIDLKDHNKKVIASVVVDYANLTWEVGAIDAKIGVTATFLKTRTSIGLVADTLVVVEGLVQDPKHWDQALLKVSPRIIAVGPTLSHPIAALESHHIIAELIGLGITGAFRDNLVHPIPIRNAFKFSSGIDKPFPIPTGNGTILTVGVNSVGEQLSANLIYRAIIAPSGIWALAKVAAPGQAQMAIDPDMPSTGYERSHLSDTRDALTAQLAPYGSRGSDVAVHIANSLFTTLGNQFNALDAAKRTVTAHSTAVTGDLYVKDFPKGHLNIGLVNAGALNGVLVTGHLTNTWDPAHAQVGMTLPVSASVDVGLHLQVTVLFGGGVGTSVGMLGGALGAVAANASVRVLSADNQSGVFLVPDLPCQSIKVAARTDGNLIMGPLHTKVPPIGADLNFVVGKTQQKPIAIMDTIPHDIPLTNVQTGSGGNGIYYQLTNLATKSDAAGTWISTNFTVSSVKIAAVSPGQPDPTVILKAQMANDVQTALSKTRPGCNLPMNLQLRLGDVDIGGGNDLVKASVAIAQGLTDAAVQEKQRADELALAAKQLAQKPLNAPQILVEHAKTLLLPPIPLPVHWKWR